MNAFRCFCFCFPFFNSKLFDRSHSNRSLLNPDSQRTSNKACSPARKAFNSLEQFSSTGRNFSYQVTPSQESASSRPNQLTPLHSTFRSKAETNENPLPPDAVNFLKNIRTFLNSPERLSPDPDSPLIPLKSPSEKIVVKKMKTPSPSKSTSSISCSSSAASSRSIQGVATKEEIRCFIGKIRKCKTEEYQKAFPNLGNDPLEVFHSSKSPKRSLEDYALSLCENLSFSEEHLDSTLMYLTRVTENIENQAKAMGKNLRGLPEDCLYRLFTPIFPFVNLEKFGMRVTNLFLSKISGIQETELVKLEQNVIPLITLKPRTVISKFLQSIPTCGMQEYETVYPEAEKDPLSPFYCPPFPEMELEDYLLRFYNGLSLKDCHLSLARYFLLLFMHRVVEQVRVEETSPLSAYPIGCLQKLIATSLLLSYNYFNYYSMDVIFFSKIAGIPKGELIHVVKYFKNHIEIFQRTDPTIPKPRAYAEIDAFLCSIPILEVEEGKDPPPELQKTFLQTFCSSRKPSVTLREYISRFYEHIYIRKEHLALSLYYLDTLLEQLPQITVGNKSSAFFHDLCMHRLLAVSLLTACKFLDDENFKDEYIAKVAGLTIKELKELELEFIFLIGFNCLEGFNEEKGCFPLFDKYLKSIESISQQILEQGSPIVSSSTTEENSSTEASPSAKSFSKENSPSTKV